MRYLLDTCTLLWFFQGSAKIPPRVVEELTDPSHEVLFSDVSVLEIVIKHQLGKLPLPKPPSRWLFQLAARHELEHVAMTPDVYFELEKLPLHHRDPFDRLLVAQARRTRAILVTPDEKIHAYDVRWMWSATFEKTLR